jgi:hypothetical protein
MRKNGFFNGLKKGLAGLLIAGGLGYSNLSAQEGGLKLFEVKKGDHFRIINFNNQPWDESHGMHFTFNLISQAGLDDILRNRGVKYHNEISAVSLLAAGIAKEVIDGKREGFSEKDLVCNIAGIGASYLIKKLTTRDEVYERKKREEKYYTAMKKHLEEYNPPSAYPN